MANDNYPPIPPNSPVQPDRRYTPDQAPAIPTQHKSTFKTFAISFCGAALACILVGGIAMGVGIIRPGNITLGGSGGPSITASISDDGDETLSEQVAAKVLPSVVAIDVYTNQGSVNMYSFGPGRHDHGTPDRLVHTSLGSGVIISADGYILTNNHVVSDASQLMVTLNDGSEYEASLVGADESSDLAVIKVDGSGLTAVELGTSHDVKVGEWVMSAGSPFGLEQSVATGIISATSRTITVSNDASGFEGHGDVSVYPGMLQTDAAINPGNSGGALVDSKGRLIGINSVIESYSGSYSGVGFAIPVDYAMDIAQQIIDGKTPSHASLGVSVASVNEEIAAHLDLDPAEGAYINGVYADSAAQEAGLQEGDVIVKFNDAKIANATDLIAAVRIAGVDSEATITYVRDGKKETCKVILGSDSSPSPFPQK